VAEKLTIFISGTMRDLPTEREQVAAAIRDMGLDPVWAEERGAADRPSHEECERMARNCHVYLGLYGLSYGWKFPPEEIIAATEFEWQTAKRAGKPMLIYRQKGQPDPEQAAFLEKVGDWQQGRFWYEFETLDDLLSRLRDDLARLIAESFRPKRLADLADYRTHLRQFYADLPLSGIPVPLDVTLPLDRVYIKLRALPEQEEAARRKAALTSDYEDLPRRLAERLWRRREEGDEVARRLKEAKPIPPEEAITQHDCLVILGEVGAGKSTLLRHLAWERAGDPEAPLPLLVPLGRADALISQTGCSFLEAALDLLTEQKAGEERGLLKQALADAIQDRKVLFLCDGLDEAHLARRSVVTGLEKLAAEGQRLVITSHPLGYERLAARDMEHFQVLPLLPGDAQAFSERWFQALAQARGVPEAEREGWAVERAGWLQRQLDERPGLREVARNPLLLTFLAVLAGDELQRDLPARRKELYREYVERLIKWEEQRQPDRKLVLGELHGEKARRVALWGLYCTAWHLHRAYYGDEGPQAVRGEIEPLLARDLRERWELGVLQAEALAAEVLRFWEGAGLLDVHRLVGQEWLAFRHLTFQEYGAARVLAELPASDRWAALRPYLHDPRWREVVLLTAGLVPNPNQFVLSILEAKSKLNKYLHRDELFAASCLAQFDQVDRQIGDRILGSLRRLVRSPIRGLAVDAWNVLSGLGSTPLASRAVDIALNEMGYDTWWGRFVGRFSHISVWGDKLDKILIYIMRQLSGRDDTQASLAVSCLGWLGQASPRVISALLWALADLEPNVRTAAAESLGQLGQNTPEIITALRLCLSDDYASVSKEAALSLTQLGYRDPEVTAILNRWLIKEYRKTREDWVRNATMTVSMNSPGSETAKLIDEVAESIHRAPDELRGGVSSEYIDTFVQALQYREPYVCEKAAFILGESGDASPHVVGALVNTLRDRRRGLREDLKAHRWLQALLWLFSNLSLTDEYWVSVRAEAARSLGKLGCTSSEVLDALVRALHDVGTEAYYALLKLVRTN
jgi:hypothetical protein